MALQEAIELLTASMLEHAIKAWLELTISTPIADDISSGGETSIHKTGNQCVVSPQ